MSLKYRVVVALLLVVPVTAGCGSSDPQPELVRPIRAIRVGDLRTISGREFPGRAKAKSEVELSFQVSGPLISLPVDVGTVVKKGDMLAAIDPRNFRAALDNAQGNLDRSRANLLAMERGARAEEIEQLRASVEQAEASYRQAAAEHERNTNLIKIGAATPAEFEISQARAERTSAEVNSAKEALNIGLKGAREEDLEAQRSEVRALEAAVATANNQLDYAVLTAPFDGEVAARYVDNFQTAQTKQPIVRLLDVSTIEVTVQVPEGLISLAPQVKQVVCRFDAFPDREFMGRVTKIGSEASQTTRTYPVTVELDQPEGTRILPGMAASIRHQPDESVTTTEHALIVPPAALFTTAADRKNYVWIIDEESKKVSRREVKTGLLTPAGMTVTEGLQRGEWVVTTGVNSLSENQQVRLLEEESE